MVKFRPRVSQRNVSTGFPDPWRGEGDSAYAAGAWGQIDTRNSFLNLEQEAEKSGDIQAFADSVSSALQAGTLKLGSGEPGDMFKGEIEKYCTAKPGDHSWLYETLGDGAGAKAFAQMLQAATIPPAGASSQLKAECQKNAVNLVKWWSSSDAKGVNTTQPVQAFYGTLVKHYWKDVVFSVTAPHDGAAEAGLSPDGMKVNASQWASFIEQAMHNPKTSGDILALGHAQQKAFELAGADIPSKDPDVMDADAWKAGLIGGFVDNAATVTYQDLVKENQDAVEWQAEAEKQAGQFVGEAADLAVDAVADPGALAKTAVTGIAKDVLHLLTDDWQPSPKAPTLEAPKLDSWQGTYANDVNTNFEAHQNEAFPYSSIHKYATGSANFTGDNFSKIIPWDQMTQPQKAAYLQWLQDPAVVEFQYQAGESTVEGLGYFTETNQQEREAGN